MKIIHNTHPSRNTQSHSASSADRSNLTQRLFFWTSTLYFKVLLKSSARPTAQELLRSIRGWTAFFIVALVLSGVTAFPVETLLGWTCSWFPWKNTVMYDWLITCYSGIAYTNEHFPFIAYGLDWLAFAHIVIGIFFIGLWKDPIRNIWLLEAGSIACILIIPLAFIAGSIREIPFYWQLIDCSFGVLGLIPLHMIRKKIRLLELKLKQH